jgi:hypothetical protein
LARTMGKKDPRSIRIELKISHEEFVRDGGHDPTKDQLVYAALPPPWADRDQQRTLSHHQRKETHRLSHTDRLEWPYPAARYFFSKFFNIRPQSLPSQPMVKSILGHYTRHGRGSGSARCPC